MGCGCVKASPAPSVYHASVAESTAPLLSTSPSASPQAKRSYQELSDSKANLSSRTQPEEPLPKGATLALAKSSRAADKKTLSKAAPPSQSVVVGDVCDVECSCASGPAVQADVSAWIKALPKESRDVEQAWHAKLSELQFYVLRMKGTEEIFSGEYCDFFEDGTYLCRGCSRPIYDSSHKFRTGHGWPAFTDCLPGALVRHGKGKVEITCAGCEGHIGHVFKSSRYPKPHHERHCSNSVSLHFVPRSAHVHGPA